MIASRYGLLEIVKLLVEAIMRFPEVEKQRALDQTRKVSALCMQPSEQSFIWKRSSEQKVQTVTCNAITSFIERLLDCFNGGVC